MALLLYSTYCPNPLCGLTWTFGAQEWRVARISEKDMIPTWATRGWYLIPSANYPDENSNSSMELLEKLLGKKWTACTPGWKIEEYHRSKTNRSEMLVFAKKPMT